MDVAPEQGREGRRVVAFAGGRGGIGRSLLAANLGVYLAQIGKGVVLVDADLGGASQHTLLGIERPLTSLTQVIDRQADHVDELIVDTPVPGLRLLSGAGDRFGVANLRPTQKERLLQQLCRVDADYVLLDVGGGTSFNVLDTFLVADFGVLVVVPEPTAVEAAYRFIKSAVIRMVRREVGQKTQWPQVLDDTVARLGGLPGPLELREALTRGAAPLADLVDSARSRLKPRLVVNRTKVRGDLHLGGAMRTAAAHLLGVTLEYLGSVEADDAVWHAARRRRPLMIESPAAQAANDIERIARKLLTPAAPDRDRPSSRTPAPVSALNHYELLEVDVGADDDEIRRGHRRLREIYGAESLAAYSLLDEGASAEMLARAQRAYDALIDPAKRRSYDLAMPAHGSDAAPRPGGVPTSTDGAEAAEAPEEVGSPLDIEITGETEFDGALLRRVRESLGVSLRDVTARTKIGITYLKAIEEEEFDLLPALVYTSGFVRELAKQLRLDHQQVVKTYIRRFRRYLEETGKLE